MICQIKGVEIFHFFCFPAIELLNSYFYKGEFGVRALNRGLTTLKSISLKGAKEESLLKCIAVSLSIVSGSFSHVSFTLKPLKGC